MARIVFTPNLSRHVDCPAAEADGATVREALEAVFRANERLRGYVLDDQSGVAPPHGDRRRRQAAARPRPFERPHFRRQRHLRPAGFVRRVAEEAHERQAGRVDTQGFVLGRTRQGRLAGRAGRLPRRQRHPRAPRPAQRLRLRRAQSRPFRRQAASPGERRLEGDRRARLSAEAGRPRSTATAGARIFPTA